MHFFIVFPLIVILHFTELIAIPLSFPEVMVLSDIVPVLLLVKIKIPVLAGLLIELPEIVLAVLFSAQMPYLPGEVI